VSQSVLGSVTMGFEPIWNSWRKPVGYRLWIDALQPTAVDAAHLLQAITELHRSHSVPLLLTVRTPALLQSLLEHPAVPGIWLAIKAEWMGDALFAGRVREAHHRGVPLVWHGEPGEKPLLAIRNLFHKTLLSLSPEQALTALRISLRQYRESGLADPSGARSPVEPGALYEGLASPALVSHALDSQQAAGIVGWPGDEILHGYRLRQIQPNHDLCLRIIRALEQDEGMERIELLLGQEPLLTYRFLRWMNSAGLGLQREIHDVRTGLMTIGYTRLRDWLMGQLPHTSNDPNLNPVRISMVLRARIMELLTDAGVEDNLRREVFLCGLFSQVDLLLGEPLGTAMAHLPLPGRVDSAILGQTGPYAPWLEVASALESSNTNMIREVCRAHEIAQESVNRALLRALVSV
jgi:hypothetical protein